MADSFLPEQSRAGAEALDSTGRHDPDALDVDSDTDILERDDASDASDDGEPPSLPTSYVPPSGERVDPTYDD